MQKGIIKVAVFALLLGLAPSVVLAESSAVGNADASVSSSVSSPTKGDVWTVGQAYTISWSGTSASAGLVDISLEPYYSCMDSSPRCLLALQTFTVATGVPNNGSFVWTIPTTLSSAFLGQVRLNISTKNFSNYPLKYLQSLPFTITNKESKLSMSFNGNVQGVVGQEYSGEFTALGGQEPYKWSLAGVLPAGLSFSTPVFNCITTPCDPPTNFTAKATLKGVPSKAGMFSYSVILTDNTGAVVKGNFELKISEKQNSPLKILSPVGAEQWHFGVPQKIQWTGNGASAVNISISRYISCLYEYPSPCKIAQPLPVTIATNIAGESYAWIPAKTDSLTDGVYTIEISTTTVEGRTTATSGVFNLVSRTAESGDLSLVAESSLKGNVGKPLAVNFRVSGGMSPYLWNVKSKLPDGLRFNPLAEKAQNCPLGSIGKAESVGLPDSSPLCCMISAPVGGANPPVSMSRCERGARALLSGTPTRAGNYEIILQVGDSTGKVKEEKFLLYILTNGATGTLQPADLVRTPDRAIHLILDGNRYYTFPSFAEYTAKGYRNAFAVSVKTEQLAGLSRATSFERPSNTTFKYVGDRTIYYLTSALCKQAYASMGSFRAWKQSTSSVVTMPAGEEFPTCSKAVVQVPDGTAVRVSGKTVYILEGGQMRPVVSSKALTARGYSFSQVFDITEGEKQQYPEGEVIQ